MHPLSGSSSLPAAPQGLAKGPVARDHKHSRHHVHRPVTVAGARTPLSGRQVQVTRIASGAAMHAVAKAIADETLRREEVASIRGCADKLRKLGAALSRPVPPALVRSMADQVAALLGTTRIYDSRQLVDVLVEVLGGAGTMDQTTLRLVTTRLLAAALQADGSCLYSGMRSLCHLLGGSAMAPAHRRTLLEACLDVTAPIGLSDGLDAVEREQRRVSVSTLLLCAMTDPSLPGGHPGPHLDAIVAHVVAPAAFPVQPTSPRLDARAALLQGLCLALARQHGPDDLGAAYLDALQRAPAFDAALYEHATDRFVFAELFRDQPTAERGAARIRAFAQGAARWALARDTAARVMLMSGTCNSLYNDTPFTPALFAALMHGVLDVVPADRSESLTSLVIGLVEPAMHSRQLAGEHVTQLLAIAWALPSFPVGDTRREVIVLTLADALAQADWPDEPTQALVDGLLAGAPGQGSNGWAAAGVYLGRCLAPLLPTTDLFAQVIEQMVHQPDLASACQLLAGFFGNPAVAPDNAEEFDAIAQVLAPPTTTTTTSPDAWLAATRIAQFAVALGAHRETASGSRRLAPYFRVPGIGKDAKGAPDVARPTAVSLGLDLAIDPVRAVRRAGGSASQQLDRLEMACEVQGLLDTERLHHQVRQLAVQDFGPDLALCADMLGILFARHASRARPKTVLAARAAILRDHDRASDDPSAASPRERVDGKGLAPASVGTRVHLRTVLDGIYRDYVTAGRLLDPPPRMGDRLTWLESVLDPVAGGVVAAWERGLVSAMRADYAHRLVPDPPQPSEPQPAPGGSALQPHPHVAGGRRQAGAQADAQ